jgi:hypothetical protein
VHHRRRVVVIVVVHASADRLIMVYGKETESSSLVPVVVTAFAIVAIELRTKTRAYNIIAIS